MSVIVAWYGGLVLHNCIIMTVDYWVQRE